MNKSIFVRFLLAPLVALGVVLGVSISHTVATPSPVKAASLVTTTLGCTSTLKNDRLVDSADGQSYICKVLFGCVAGAGCPCQIRCWYQIYDAENNPVRAGLGGIRTLQCGSADRTVSFNPVAKTWAGQGLGWHYCQYTIEVLDCDGEPVEELTIIDGEWYYVDNIA